MTRIIRLVALLLAIAIAPVAARATEITVASQQIKNWQYTAQTGTGVVYMRVYVDRSFVTSDGRPVLPGNPQGGAVYRIVRCDLSGPDASGNYTLTIPSFTIDSTTDAQDAPGKGARYSAYFYTPQGRQLAIYGGFEQFRVLPAYALVPPTNSTWALIRADNTAPIAPPLDLIRYTNEQIDRIIANATSSVTFTLNGVMAPNQTFGNDTNVVINSSGSVHQLGWSGQLLTPRGGTGLATATPNGVLYGQGAGALGVTAAPPANSILVGSAGAPSFSQTPIINTSVTIGVASSQTGQLILRNQTNANTVTISPGATSASYPIVLPTAQGAAGSLLQNDGSGNLSFTTTPSLGATTLASATVSNLTQGRVVVPGASGLLTSDPLFLFDASTDRLSIGTTRSDASITIPNANYLAAVRADGAAGVALIGLNASNQLALAAGGNRIQAISEFFNDVAPSATYSGGSPEYDNVALSYSNPPFSFGFAQRGVWSSNGTGNNWAIVGNATSSGTRPGVGVVGIGHATGTAATQTFGGNFIADVPTSGTAFAGAQAGEFNPVNLGSNPNVGLTGITIQNVGGTSFGTVLGTFKSYIQLNVSTGSLIDHRAAARYGILLDASAIDPLVTGSEAASGGYTSSLIRINGSTSPTFIFDLAGAHPTSAAILLANDAPFKANTTGGSAATLITLTNGDFVEAGEGNYSVSGPQGFSAHDGGGRFMLARRSGTAGVPGNVGWNQITPTAQHHVTAIAKRSLSGTVNFNAGVPTVINSASGTSFVAEVAAGNSIELSWQTGTYYTVASVTSSTITLTSSAASAGSFTGGTLKSDAPTLLVESRSGDDWLALDNRHALNLYGDGGYSDFTGLLALRGRVDPNRGLWAGFNETGEYGYLSSAKLGVGWKPLFFQAGAGGGGTGGVVIGTPTASTNGAMLKVESARANAGAPVVATELNDLSTNTTGTAYDKISLQLLNQGSWYGRNIAVYARPIGAADSTTGHRTNYPLFAVAGKSLFGPTDVQVTLPTPPAAPTATLEVYGYATEAFAGTGVDLLKVAVTNASDVVTASGGTTFAGLKPGQSLQFGSDLRTYKIAYVDSSTQLHLDTGGAGYQGSTATLDQGWSDPALFRVRTGFGDDRLVVDAGQVAIGAALTLKRVTSAIAPNASKALSLRTDVGGAFNKSGNVFHVAASANNLSTLSDGVDGQIIVLIADGAITVEDATGNINLTGSSTNLTMAAKQALWLVFDSSLSQWIQIAPSSANAN